MKKSCLFGCLWMGMLLAAASAQTANLPGEAEAATHGDEAADVNWLRYARSSWRPAARHGLPTACRP